MKITVYLKSGEIIHKRVANWDETEDGFFASNSKGQPVLRVFAEGLEAYEIDELDPSKNDPDSDSS